MKEPLDGQVPPGGPKRSLNDFAHLFLTRPGEKKENGTKRPETPPPEEDPPPTDRESPPPEEGSPPDRTRLDPLPAPPPSSPRPAGPTLPSRSAVFLGSGEGWLRTFLAAETALYLSREGFPVVAAQEGGLFPTISGHLGRRPAGRKGKGGGVRIVRAGPDLTVPAGGDPIFLAEIPAHLPPWALRLCRRARLLVLAVPANPAGRIRAFHQLKRILPLVPEVEVGVAAAERPGSGEGREVFHRFLAAQADLLEGRTSFLGALPLESALEKVILAERKPSLLWFPGSLTAAAVGRIGAGILRKLQPLEAAR